jgi:hypothetical protein
VPVRPDSCPQLTDRLGFDCTASSGAAVIGVLVAEIEFVLVAIALGGFAVQVSKVGMEYLQAVE